MRGWAEAFGDATDAALRARSDPVRAIPMRRYMRDQFAFLGVPGPERRLACREATAVAGAPESGDDPLEAARMLWAKPGREHQYVISTSPVGRWSAGPSS